MFKNFLELSFEERIENGYFILVLFIGFLLGLLLSVLVNICISKFSEKTDENEAKLDEKEVFFL